MVKELFDFVLENYKNSYKYAQADDPNYKVLVNSFPIKLKTFFHYRNDLMITGSCGNGQKTDWPWVGIFNKSVTSSAQKGLYVVYLFKKDLSGFYLTLNQGITFFKEQYKGKSYACARKVASYFKNEIGDKYFDKSDIDLVATSGTLGYGYQATTILSKYYAKGSYNDQMLKDDLDRMLAIYDEIVGVLGEDNYDYNSAIKKILFDINDSFETATDGIDEIKNAISSPIDVNVLRTLQEVVPTSKRSQKYAKMRSSDAIKKTDWIEKAKTDAEIGLLGEMLALSYERERLINEGYPELADKVKHVAAVSDAFGYDIISYTRIGLNMEEIYIEVKTTTNKLDVDFPVSKNEELTSNDKDDHYCIFRIYDVKSVNPSFYKVFGKLKDNFELDPITFMAKYIGK